MQDDQHILHDFLAERAERRQDVERRIGSLLALATEQGGSNAITVSVAVDSGEGGDGLKAEAHFVI